MNRMIDICRKRLGELDKVLAEKESLENYLKIYDEGFEDGKKSALEKQKVSSNNFQIDESNKIGILPNKRGRIPSSHLTKGTVLYDVRGALIKAAKPLHISEIMNEIGMDYRDRKKKVSLVGSLNQYAKKGKFFINIGENTFDLREKDGK